MARSSVPAPTAIAMLARPSGAHAAFLHAHHVEVACVIQRLFERARLQPRVTQSFSTLPRGGGAGSHVADMSDMAADARKRLGALQKLLPSDCAGVLLDVCGFDKALQAIESERGWPRRSAKLVLRIALDSLAPHLGLCSQASGGEARHMRAWHGDGARPTELG